MRYIITLLLLATAIFAESDFKFDPIVKSEALYILDDVGGEEAGYIIPGSNKVGGIGSYKNVSTTVSVKLTTEMDIAIDKAFIKWNPAELTHIKMGYDIIPFGEYTSNLVNFPLIRYGTDNIRGLSTSAVQLNMGTTMLGIVAEGCVYADDLGAAQSVAGKLKYNFKDIVNISISGRSELIRTHDLDFALEVTPVDWLSIIAEVYTGFKNDKFGYYTEIGFIPTDNVILSVRTGAILNDTDNSYGKAQLSAGPLFIINDYFVVGLEWNTTWNVHRGAYKDNNNSIATLLSFSL